MTKRHYTLAALAAALILAALLYAKPWQSSAPTPTLSAQPQPAAPDQIVTCPKSGKQHPLSAFKPAPNRPGWVLCPDTGQPLPLTTLRR